MAVEAKRGTTLPRPVELVKPADLPHVKAWRGFKPDHPIAVAWTVLAERRPLEARLHVENETTGSIGISTTREVAGILQDIYGSPAIGALEQILLMTEHPDFTAKFIPQVEASSWSKEEKQRGILLGWELRAEIAQQKADGYSNGVTTCQKEYDRQRTSAQNSSFSSDYHHELIQDAAEKLQNTAEAARKWKETVALCHEAVTALEAKEVKPLTIGEVHGLIADVVDAALATSQTA